MHDGGRLPPQPAPIQAPFADDFERVELGSGWNATSAAYRIDGGKLEVSNASTTRPGCAAAFRPMRSSTSTSCPRARRATSRSSCTATENPSIPTRSYDSTGYVLIFGGWHNTLSVICRMESTAPGAKPNATTSR